MSLSRGKFLRSLGSSVLGTTAGTGLAIAEALLHKVGSLAPDEKSSGPALSEPPFLEQGPASSNQVALTFDDGPTPGVTAIILDELKRRNVKATFFMIGERVAGSPELARRILAEGHEIGNHTYTHPKLTSLSDEKVTEELQKTQDVFSNLLNHRATCFRPPYGQFRRNQGPLARQLGLDVVLWSANPRDWDQPGEDAIFETIQTQLHSGAIIICHDVHFQTARVLPRILDLIAERSLDLVPVSRFITR